MIERIHEIISAWSGEKIRRKVMQWDITFCQIRDVNPDLLPEIVTSLIKINSSFRLTWP